MNVLRHVAIGQARVAGHAPLEIDNAKLPRLVRGVGTEQLNNALGVCSLLELFKHQHLVGMRAIDAGLTGGNAESGHDHRLHTHEKAIVVVYAGR